MPSHGEHHGSITSNHDNESNHLTRDDIGSWAKINCRYSPTPPGLEFPGLHTYTSVNPEIGSYSEPYESHYTEPSPRRHSSRVDLQPESLYPDSLPSYKDLEKFYSVDDATEQPSPRQGRHSSRVDLQPESLYPDSLPSYKDLEQFYSVDGPVDLEAEGNEALTGLSFCTGQFNRGAQSAHQEDLLLVDSHPLTSAAGALFRQRSSLDLGQGDSFNPSSPDFHNGRKTRHHRYKSQIVDNCAGEALQSRLSDIDVIDDFRCQSQVDVGQQYIDVKGLGNSCHYLPQTSTDDDTNTHVTQDSRRSEDSSGLHRHGLSGSCANIFLDSSSGGDEFILPMDYPSALRLTSEDGQFVVEVRRMNQELNHPGSVTCDLMTDESVPGECYQVRPQSTGSDTRQSSGQAAEVAEQFLPGLSSHKALQHDVANSERMAFRENVPTPPPRGQSRSFHCIPEVLRTEEGRCWKRHSSLSLYQEEQDAIEDHYDENVRPQEAPPDYDRLPREKRTLENLRLNRRSRSLGRYRSNPLESSTAYLSRSARDIPTKSQQMSRQENRNFSPEFTRKKLSLERSRSGQGDRKGLGKDMERSQRGPSKFSKEDRNVEEVRDDYRRSVMKRDWTKGHQVRDNYLAVPGRAAEEARLYTTNRRERSPQRRESPRASRTRDTRRHQLEDETLLGTTPPSKRYTHLHGHEDRDGRHVFFRDKEDDGFPQRINNGPDFIHRDILYSQSDLGYGSQLWDSSSPSREYKTLEEDCEWFAPNRLSQAVQQRPRRKRSYSSNSHLERDLDGHNGFSGQTRKEAFQRRTPYDDHYMEMTSSNYGPPPRPPSPYTEMELREYRTPYFSSQRETPPKEEKMSLFQATPIQTGSLHDVRQERVTRPWHKREFPSCESAENRRFRRSPERTPKRVDNSAFSKAVRESGYFREIGDRSAGTYNRDPSHDVDGRGSFHTRQASRHGDETRHGGDMRHGDEMRHGSRRPLYPDEEIVNRGIDPWKDDLSYIERPSEDSNIQWLWKELEDGYRKVNGERFDHQITSDRYESKAFDGGEGRQEFTSPEPDPNGENWMEYSMYKGKKTNQKSYDNHYKSDTGSVQGTVGPPNHGTGYRKPARQPHKSNISDDIKNKKDMPGVRNFSSARSSAPAAPRRRSRRSVNYLDGPWKVGKECEFIIDLRNLEQTDRRRCLSTPNLFFQDQPSQERLSRGRTKKVQFESDMKPSTRYSEQEKKMNSDRKSLNPSECGQGVASAKENSQYGHVSAPRDIPTHSVRTEHKGYLSDGDSRENKDDIGKFLNMKHSISEQMAPFERDSSGKVVPDFYISYEITEGKRPSGPADMTVSEDESKSPGIGSCCEEDTRKTTTLAPNVMKEDDGQEVLIDLDMDCQTSKASSIQYEYQEPELGCGNPARFLDSVGHEEEDKGSSENSFGSHWTGDTVSLGQMIEDNDITLEDVRTSTLEQPPEAGDLLERNLLFPMDDIYITIEMLEEGWEDGEEEAELDAGHPGVTEGDEVDQEYTDILYDLTSSSFHPSLSVYGAVSSDVLAHGGSTSDPQWTLGAGCLDYPDLTQTREGNQGGLREVLTQTLEDLAQTREGDPGRLGEDLAQTREGDPGGLEEGLAHTQDGQPGRLQEDSPERIPGDPCDADLEVLVEVPVLNTHVVMQWMQHSWVLLDTTGEFSERRKIRAALRDLIDNSTSVYKKSRRDDLNIDMEAIKRHSNIMEAFPNTADRRASFQFRKRHGMLLTKENIQNRLESIRNSHANPYEDIADMEELNKKLKEATEVEERVQIRTAIRKLRESQNGDEKEETVRRSADQPEQSVATNNGTIQHGGSDLNGVARGRPTPDYSEISDIHQLEDMLLDTTDYSERKKIRTAIHDLRKERLATISRRLSRAEDTVTVPNSERQESHLVVKLRETAPSDDSTRQINHAEDTDHRQVTRIGSSRVVTTNRRNAQEETASKVSSDVLERMSSKPTDRGVYPWSSAAKQENGLGDATEEGDDDVSPTELNSEDHGKDSTEPPKEMDSEDHGKDSTEPPKEMDSEDHGKDSTEPPKEMDSEDHGKDSTEPPKEMDSEDHGKDSTEPPKEMDSEDHGKGSTESPKEMDSEDHGKGSTEVSSIEINSEDYGKGSTKSSTREMNSEDYGKGSNNVSTVMGINSGDHGEVSTDVSPIEINPEDHGKDSTHVSSLEELTSKDHGKESHNDPPPEVTSKPKTAMDDLNGRLAELENELDDCKEFDRRREIRAQIRDIRSQIRENTIKMSSRHTKVDLGKPPLSRMSCLTDTSRPPKDVSLTRSFSTKEQGRNFLARKIQSQIVRSNSTREKGTRNSAPPGTLQSKEVTNAAAVGSPYKVDSSRNQMSDYSSFSAIKTRRIKRGDVKPVDDFIHLSAPAIQPEPPQDHLSKDKSSSSDEMLDCVDAKIIVASLTEHQRKSVRSSEGRKEPRRVLTMGDRTLNMSKASSGYGSVSGSSEEEEKEEDEQDAVVPEILQSLSDMTFTDDEPVTLTCKISGGPKVKVLWYKDSNLLKSSENVQQSLDGTEARLTLTDVCEEDSGEYKCVVTTSAGSKETAAYVTITENTSMVAPSVEKPLSDVIVKDGADVTFECHVSGKPPPKLTWFKGSQLLKDSPDFRQTYQDGVARMTMEDVFPDDNGSYICVAVNETGECQTTCTLTVQEEVTEGVEAPDIVTVLENIEAVDGDTVTFKCQISGVPKPMLTWYKDDKLLPNCSDFEQTYDGKTAMLVIDEVFEDDTGEYKVLAKNSAGDASIAALLNVRGTPQTPEVLPPAKPNFTSILPSQLTVIDGDSAHLECRLTPSPRQTVIWYKDSKIIRPGIGYKQTFDGTLAKFDIREVFPDDAGRYECAAKNDFGEDRCSCQVNVKEERRERNFDETYKNLNSAKSKPLGGSTSLSRVHSMNVRLQDEKNRLRPPGGAKGLSRVQSLKAKLDNNMDQWTKHESVTSSKFGIKAAKMPDTDKDIDSIDDEDVLHKMMTDTTDFNLRKKIRARMRDVREAKSAEFQKSQSSMGKREDAVQMRQRIAEQDKERKLKEMDKFAKIKRERTDIGEAEKGIRERHLKADEEKQKKLEGYKEMGKVMSQVYHAGTDVAMKLDHAKAAQLKARHFGKGGSDEDSTVTTTKTERGPDGSTTTTNVTSVRKTTKDGSSITTTQTKQVTQTGGLGKTTYTVKKSSAASSSSSGPNLLEAGGGGGRVAVQRSPSAIKDMLLTWCKQMTKDYDNVEIKNFSSSWNDGMAFAALIHHFRPVFDYKRLNPKCRRGNFKLAFDVAEKFAEIAPLLDVDDMVKMKNPDWKCVFTYVQSFYRRFRDDPLAQPGGVAN